MTRFTIVLLFLVAFIILVVAILAISSWRFKNSYLSDIKHSFRQENQNAETLTEQDLASLPQVVRKYLKYTGHTQKTNCFNARFKGVIRSGPDAEWMNFSATQFSWTNQPTRYFFMNAAMKGLPIAGYHCFKNGHASMDIRILSMIPVSKQSGREMDIAETVTHLNDMCLLAPSSLIDRRISWVRANDHEAELIFSHNDIKVKAVLQFNDKGELVNFISDDRFMMVAGQAPVKARWSTPISAYKEAHGIRFPASGEAVWETPEATFAYAKMDILSIEINPIEKH